MSPRVLELFEAPDGGVPEHVRQLAHGLDGEWELTTAGPPQTGVRAELEAAATFVPVPIVGSMTAPRTDGRTLRALWRLIRSDRFDLVHVHGLKPALIGRALAIVRGVPVIYTPHCFIYRNQGQRAGRSAALRRAVLLAAERLLGRRTATIVGVSAEETQAAVADHLVDSAHARTIRNGVAPDLDVPARPELVEFRGDGPLFGMVAGLRDQKGAPTLLDALELLGARGGAPRTAIVGDGPQAPQLRERIAASPLAATTTVLGFGGHSEPNLAALDVFVLPSYWEGLPIAVLEAMAMGLPVIATDVGGTSEAVVHEETGLLVPPRDPEALAGAIERLAGDPEERGRMGRAGRERALEGFTTRRMTDEVEALYREVLRRGT